MVPYTVPRALEKIELPGIAQAFAEGAKNAIAAGKPVPFILSNSIGPVSDSEDRSPSKAVQTSSKWLNTLHLN